MEPTSRTDINRRLDEIQQELWNLDPIDFKTRYELQRERDLLRDQVRTSADSESDRSTDELRAELEARRKSLAQIQESMVNSAGMIGGGDGSGPFKGPDDGGILNTEIVAATGAERLAQRIARLEMILSERGAL